MNHEVRFAGYIYRTGFFRNLNDSAIAHIPLAKKFPIIRPFAWLYQLIRRGIKGIFHLLRTDDREDLKDRKRMQNLLMQIGI